jgi:hypothetical protein
MGFKLISEDPPLIYRQKTLHKPDRRVHYYC